MSFGRAFRVVALALGAITLVLAAVSVVLIVRTRAFLAESVTAAGEVVGVEPRQSCDEHRDERGDEHEVCSTVYAPRVRFTTADGREVVFVSSLASSPASYTEGDRVDVRYRPARPGEAQIDTVTGVWFGSLVVGGITVVFAALTAVWVVLAVRFRRE